MILDKLLKTRDQSLRTIVHPLYQLFPLRLKLFYFNEVNTNFGVHPDFKNTIKNDMEENGLLCPMVLDMKNVIKSGNHRFRILNKNKLADASLFYKSQSDAEVSFFSHLNVEVWKMHSAKTPPISFEFLFKDPMKKYTERCLHLLQEGVKLANVT